MVSYLSKPVQLTNYIPPVDLELLGKVNSYKQSLFYQNAKSISNQLGQMQNADIANEAQKKYLTDAVNSVTQKIDSYGAVDYSDMNVYNSIESLGQEITKDPTIINGITSTKQLRTLSANYQKMANDPKYSKYYSQAYETYDYEHYIKPYTTSEDINATYSGPTNPTIFTGNPLEKAAKIIKQANPEITEEIVNGVKTGGYINVQTNKRYTPEQLTTAFDGIIDGQTKTELVKNAWYTLDYSNRTADGKPIYGEDDYAKMALSQQQKLIDNDEASLKVLNSLVISSGINPEQKQQLQNNIQTTTERIANGKQALAETDKNFRTVFRKDKEGALTQIYTHNLKTDLNTIFGATQSKLALKIDFDQLQEHKKEIAYINKGLTYLGKNADGSDKVVANKGVEEKTPLSDFTILEINTENSAQAEDNRLTTEKLSTQNTTIHNELNSATKELILQDVLKTKDDGAGSLYEAFQYELQATTDGGSAPSTYSSKILNKVANIDEDKNLTITDFKKVVGNTKTQQDLGLNATAVKYIQGIVDSYDKIVMGQDNDVKVSDNVRKYMAMYQDKTASLKANNYIIEEFTKKTLTDLGAKLTPNQKIIFESYLRTPEAYKSTYVDNIDKVRGNSSSIETLDPRIASTFNALGVYTKDGMNQLIRKNYQKNLSAISNRENYLSMVLKEDTDKTKIKQLVPGLENLIKIQNESVMSGQTFKDETIQPIKLTYSPEGWKIDYTIKGDKDKLYYSNTAGTNDGKFKSLILTPEQAKKLGAQVMPYPGLEQEAYVTGSSTKDYFVPTFYNVDANGVVAQNAKPVRVQAYRATNDRNNTQYAAKVYIPSLGKWKTIPFKQGDEQYGKSANSAWYYATALLENYANNNSTGFGTLAKDKDGNQVIAKNLETFYKDIITEIE
jgi:hypothetical protein